MGAIIKIKADEIQLLQKEVEAKFLSKNPHIAALRKNSFKGSYSELEAAMLEALSSREYPVSEGLLRKLFYDSVDKETKAVLPETSFNDGFLDACYLFITNNQQNRTQYLKAKMGPDKQESSKTEVEEEDQLVPGLRWKRIRLLMVVIIGAFGLIMLGKILLKPDVSHSQYDILISKFVGEKMGKGSVEEDDVKIAWYLKTEMDKHLKTQLSAEVIGTEDEAKAAGEAAQVKFVIWGEILGISEAYITVMTRFQIIQAAKVSALRDSALLAKMDAFKRETYKIGERGRGEFQKAFSKEWTCISLFAVGLSHYLDGEYAEAEPFFREGLEACPNGEGELGEELYRHYLGNIAYRKADYATALTHFRAARRIRPLDPLINGNLGSAFAELADQNAEPALLDSAEAYYRKALSLQPELKWVQENLDVILNTLPWKNAADTRPPEIAMNDTANAIRKDSGRPERVQDSFANGGVDSTAQELLDCLQGLARGGDVPALSRERVRDSILAFIAVNEKRINAIGESSSQTRCLKKLGVARAKIQQFDFHKGLPPVWSLFYKANKKSARADRIGHELECLSGKDQVFIKYQKRAFARISLMVIRYYVAGGDRDVKAKRYNRGRDKYLKGIQVASFTETSSDIDEMYEAKREVANSSDKLKSTAFLKTGYAYLMEGNRDYFCKHIQWAKFPGSSPYGVNKTYLLQYNLKNVNNVLISSEEIRKAEACCQSYWYGP